MGFLAKLPARTWLLLPLFAAAFLLWADLGWMRRVENVSDSVRAGAVVDAASPTGYAGGGRWLIVPEHNLRSYQWIAETQQMLARGEWRVRRVDYENTPVGREVHASSPYRWWLGLVAWADHTFSGRPLGLAVEHAALWADPLLHLLWLVSATLFVARRFGAGAAALLALGLATLFPLASAFLPGAPDSLGLAQVCALWSLLPLLAWTRGAAPAGRSMQRSYFMAGVDGGFGLWIGPAMQLPPLVGIALGGLLMIVAARRGAKQAASEIAPATPWRSWALGGAVTSLLAYVLEYYPHGMDLHLQVNHPLDGLAWLGAGELLAQVEAWSAAGKAHWNRRHIFAALLAVAAVAALPAVMVSRETFPTLESFANRLTGLPNGAVAGNLAQWIARDGLTGAVAATCLPVLLLIPALWLLVRRATDPVQRRALALALGPVLVAFACACHSLRWWNLADTALLVLLVAMTATMTTSAGSRRAWWSLALAGTACVAGLVQLIPPAPVGGAEEFSLLEVRGLLERDLAHWLADHAGPDGVAILAPPECTASLCFYGGLRGLGTPNWENQDGLEAAVRIVTADTPAKAQGLLAQRGITHLILPSWDTDLDSFVRWTMTKPDDTFLNALHHWAVLPWLRPLPYKLPTVAGLEDQSVAIFEVTEEANRVVALSRQAEYFAEMQQSDLAAADSKSLQLYPADLGALIARAQVAKAGDDPAAFAEIFNTLLANLAGGNDRTLPWDRRVSLAIVLAQGNRLDLARKQVERCLAQLTAPRLRSLTTASVFRLQVLAKAMDLPIADEKLRELAVQLVPAELRSRL